MDGIEPVILQRVQEQALPKRVEHSVGSTHDRAVKRRRQTLGQQNRPAVDSMTSERLSEEVERLNDTADIYNVGVRFRVHKETERIMVQVYDRRSDEVIREIPPEQVLNLVAQIQQMIGLLLDEQR